MSPESPVQEFQMKRSLICRFFFNSSIICSLGLRTKAALSYTGVLCQNQSYYSINGSYHSNLKTLFAVLSSNATSTTGFYNFTAGDKPPDIAYGFFLCRGVVTAQVCQECVTTAAGQVVEMCPRLSATIWYDLCVLRYSNQSFFSHTESTDRVPFLSNVTDQTIFNFTSESAALVLKNTQNITDSDGLNQVQGDPLDVVAFRASEGDKLVKKFAAGEDKYSSNQSLYSLAQCRPGTPTSYCRGCLSQAISGLAACCNKARGATYQISTCNIRFENCRLYNTAATVPSSPSLPPVRQNF